MTDLAYIVIATAAITAAVCLLTFHAYSRSRRRQLARVREQRDAARALALTEPIPYRLADPTAYLPVWTSDGPAMREYVQLRDASRQARQVTR